MEVGCVGKGGREGREEMWVLGGGDRMFWESWWGSMRRDVGGRGWV